MGNDGILLKNARDSQWLLIRHGKIEAVGTGTSPDGQGLQIIDARNHRILPGFIDIHVHGAAGHDTMDASPQAIEAMAQFYARHGVTSFLATTWTDSHADIEAALSNIQACQTLHTNGATLLGAHLEGPYLNASQCGAQKVEYIREAKFDEINAYLAHDVVRLISVAPEFEANHALITHAVKNGIAVSVAHSAASYQQMQQAIEQGLSHSTHTFNAMTGLHHREPGVVGAVLTAPDVSCEVIADNIHVHPAVMQLLWQVKGPDKVVLVSDAVRVTGLPEGTHQLDGRPVTLQNGAVRLSDGTLAGSCLMMDQALKNFIAATGASLDECWQVSSLNPARVIGVDDCKGSLEPGKDADIVLVNEALEIELTIVEGREVFRRETDAAY